MAENYLPGRIPDQDAMDPGCFLELGGRKVIRRQHHDGESLALPG